MCEYCDGSKKPIEAEVDNEARFTLTPDDSEHPEGFLLDVYLADYGWDTLAASFIVPHCPMCGRELRGDAE